MRGFLVVLCLLLACAGMLIAQSELATLSGRITDPTGAAVVSAGATLTNLDTNVTFESRANSSGSYTFANVPPGRYKLSVSASGFRVNEVQPVVLHVQDRAIQNVALQVGAASETISVSGEAQTINVENATVGTVVERQIVANMPLNGRSFQGLVSLSPGVVTVAAGSSATGQFVVNGQRSDTSYFTLDGVSANVGAPLLGSLSANGAGGAPTNSTTGGYNNLVSVDALQEFRISTSSFAPEFGRTPGGQVSLVSRSGTNALHGDIFNYFRNTVLDANDWFLNAAGKSRGVVQQNDFGGVVGGRVIKDKLFFFGSYEGLRLQAPTPRVVKVPTQAARNLAAAAKTGTATAYMAQFLNAYPLPDGNPTTACTSFANCTANYTASFPGKSVLDATSVRGDYNIRKNMTLFGRYNHAPSSLVLDDSVKRTNVDIGNDSYTAGWTWALTQMLNNDLRFNYTKTTLLRSVAPLKFSGSLSTIFPTGFAQPPADYAAGDLSVQMGITGVDVFQLSPVNADNGNNQLNITESVGWLKGHHGLKIGADFRQLDPGYNQVAFNWNNTFAQTNGAFQNVCPTATLPAGSGTTVPGFICGQATTANLQHNYRQDFRFREFSFFGQDTWQVSKRLTLTYGLRWDINPAVEWMSGNPSFSIDPATFNLSDMSKVGIRPFGTPAFETRWTNIAPRIGLAYQLWPGASWGSVMRVGYGIFYDTGTQTASLLGTPFNARFNNAGAGATASFVQFPISTANSAYVTPPAARLTLPVSNGGTDNIIDPHFKLPTVHQMNLSYEQQIGAAQSLTIAYVGALGRDLIGDRVYPAQRGNPATFAQINPLTGAITPDSLVVVGNFASSDYHSLQTKFQRQFTKGLGGIASYTWSHSIDTNSNSIALPAAVLPTKENAASGTPFALARASSDFDVRHVFALSLVFEAPTPKNAMLKAVFGHWTLAPIYHYQTAIPIDLLTGVTGALSGTTYSERPNVIPGVPVYVTGATCAAQYLALQGFNGCPGGIAVNLAPVPTAVATAAGCITTGLVASPTAIQPTASAKGAFCTPAAVGGQFISGNLPRNAIRAFSLSEFDFSLHRDFPFTERVRLRFQADLFNVFNHPSFGPYGTTLNSAAFGLTSAMANSALGAQNNLAAGFNPIFNTGGPRNAQFALKLFF